MKNRRSQGKKKIHLEKISKGQKPYIIQSCFPTVPCSNTVIAPPQPLSFIKHRSPSKPLEICSYASLGHLRPRNFRLDVCTLHKELDQTLEQDSTKGSRGRPRRNAALFSTVTKRAAICVHSAKNQASGGDGRGAAASTTGRTPRPGTVDSAPCSLSAVAAEF